jgi:hypothetical protein
VVCQISDKTDTGMRIEESCGCCVLNVASGRPNPVKPIIIILGGRGVPEEMLDLQPLTDLPTGVADLPGTTGGRIGVSRAVLEP